LRLGLLLLLILGLVLGRPPVGLATGYPATHGRRRSRYYGCTGHTSKKGHCSILSLL
jgi:hypothetical protein